MKGLSKKLSVLLLSVTAAACLILGALFTVNATASAETVTLEEKGNFIISGTTVVGLSDDGKRAAGDGYFAIRLPADGGLTTIASNAFKSYDKLISVEIPEGITGIGFMAFSDCTSLRSVKLPETLDSISIGAFKNCSSLLSITIPANVYEIHSTAFDGCTRLVEVWNKSEDAEININNPVINIYKNEGGGKLQAADSNGFVFFADGDKSYLVDYAGANAEITLPADYNGNSYEIYREAFRNDSFITEITVPENANITAIGEGAFWGCTSLTGITIPANVNTIADNLFYGCTSLKTVNFKNNFSVLGGSAFANCTSLESIDLPSALYEIEASAFKGCTSLKTVTFNKQITDGRYNLHFIRSSAFEDCRSLEYIELPDSVTNVQQNAFTNCLYLSTVYLPADAEFGNDVFDRDDSQLNYDYACVKLIAPDVTAYTAYKDGTLSDYTDNLTYVIELTLVYDGKEHADYRLFGCDYKYVLQDGGKVWAQNGGMPVQTGYKTSVWYKEQSYSAKVDETELNGMLSDDEAITLYAQTVDKPVLTANENLVYDREHEISWAEAAGWTEEMGAACEISITGYVPYTGTATIPEKIKDAGTYTLSAALKADDYGVWDGECTVTVVVKRAKRDLALLDWIAVDGGANRELASTDTDKPLIYVYKNDMGVDVPYLDENPSLTSAGQPKPVINSYLFYNASEQTIALKDDKAYGGELDVTYRGNVYRAAGVYTVEAEIPADNNYEFDASKGTDATYRGTNVSGLYPGSEKYTITKTWYIVAATTNGLIIGGSAYNVPLVWTYQGGAVSAPSVNFGNANDLVTFTLNRKDINSKNDYALVCGNMPYSRFEDVINHSMPVGDYQLIIKVADYTAPSGTVYEGSVQKFEFTVMNAVYENSEGKEIEEILQINSLNEIRRSTSVRFAEISGWDMLGRAEELHDIPTGNNFWAGGDYAEYYRGFEIRYSVVSDKGSSGGYFTAEDYEGKTDKNPRIVPNTVGVYNVTYIVSAPGYDSYSNEYMLIIYDELNLEDIQRNIDALNIAYNREARKPNLDTDVYRAVYIDDETNPEVLSAMSALGISRTYSYINAGEYPVALAVRDSLYVERAGCYLYRWQGMPSATAYVEVKLNIAKAENNTFTPLSVTEWHWGDPAERITVSWSTDWVKDTKQFTFELVPEDKSKEPYALADFYKADSGFYTLKAICPEGENYKEAEAEIIVFVKPAEISWLIAPQIDSWKYGNSTFKVPTPVLNTSVGALQAEIIDGARYYREGNPNGYTSLASFLDENGLLPVGKYTLVYSYTAHGNYANFRDVVSFQVLKADNYWDIAPVVNGWTYGDKSIDYLTYKPDCKPHYTDGTEVAVQFRIVDENGVEKSPWRNRLADLGLDEYGKLSVGFYEVRAELNGSANYEAMEFTMRFKVTKSQNSWDEIPNVISWNEGRINSIEDVLTAVPANGTVLITITDSNGNIIVEDELPENINVNKLKSLGAGAYTLKAYVAGSDRFEELEAYVDFAIFEDSVSQTALIALTITFAVIAIALAIVGVVLLVRRDKQIEEEFRKMIKAELYRR